MPSQVTEQRASLHWTTTVSQMASGGTPRKAVVELHLQDGSLLVRVGIAAPGEETLEGAGR